MVGTLSAHGPAGRPGRGDGHAGGGDVLLDAEVDAAVLGDVHGLGEDHGAHIRHQRHTLHLRHLDILGAEDGVVLADVDVACILVVVDGVHVRDVGEVLILAGRDDPGLAELCGFLCGQIGEVSGDDVVGLAGGHKVQRHHGELLGRAALEEADLIMIWNVHHPAQGGFGVGDDSVEPLAAVAHLHHALAAAAVFEQLCLSLLEHLFGQHAGTCAEIINSCHDVFSPFPLSDARSGVCSGFVRSIMVFGGAKQEHLCTKLSRQSPGGRTKRTNVPVQRTFSETFVK